MKSSHADALCATSISPHHSDITLTITSIVRTVVRGFTEKGKSMRLIDADGLLPMMKYATTDSEIGVFPVKIGFNEIAKVIDDAPTVDAIPIEWIEKRIQMNKLSEMDTNNSEEVRMVFRERRFGQEYLIEGWRLRQELEGWKAEQEKTNGTDK